MRRGPSISWLPVLDEFRNFLASGEGATVAEQIKQFNKGFVVLDEFNPNSLA
jgi:hypothetical protein